MSRLLSLIAVLTVSLSLPAQDGRPFAFLSESPKEPTQGPPQRVVPSLRLRPNNELPYYAYVRNPGTDAWEKLTVVLAADDKGERVLAEGSVPKINGGETVRVNLTAKTVAVPVPAPAEKPAANAPPAAPVDAPLPDAVYLLLVRATDDNPRAIVTAAAAKPLHAVRVMSPKEYLDVSTATPTGVVAGNNDLYVQVGDKNKAVPFRGKPAKVSLNVRGDLIEGLDTNAPREGTYEAFVAPGAEKITLAAKDLKFIGDKRAGFISLSADGVSNAFVYQVDFRGTSPKPVEDRGFLRIDAPKFALTGKPLPVRLELFGDDAGGQPRLKFFRSNVGSPEVVTADLTTPRDTKTGFRIGEAGELIVSSSVKDWIATMDTAGLYGERALTFELEKGNRPFTPAQTTVTFDDSAPIDIEFLKPPVKAIKGKTFTVTARARDPESGLKPKGVLFYLGDPPVEGKKPPKGTTSAGVINADGSVTAEFATPDIKGPFDVTVRFTNNVGLSSEKAVEILAFEEVKPTTGKIIGRVIQGDDRGQPGLTVELKDGEGKKLDAAQTSDTGEFKFENLKPGAYVVASVKPIDYGAKGDVKVTVVAGETAKPKISLVR